MDNRPILFLDSGVGGIHYCRDFIGRNPRETVFYLADREHFPYGPRSKNEITSLLTTLTEKLITTANPKIAVIACNTASISALAILRQNFPQLPFIGTVPAIKPAAEVSKNGIIGVLGTERTIDDIRSLNQKDDSYEIFGIAAPELVEFVEQNFGKTNKEEKTVIAKKYIAPFLDKRVASLVLGCTHFLYLLEEFRREAAGKIKIFDSVEGITKRIEYLLDENDGELRAEQAAPHRLLLTGDQPPSDIWQNRALMLGFNLCLLNEM